MLSSIFITVTFCFSGQSFARISKRIGGLFKYTNFPERYVEKPIKEDITKGLENAIGEFQKSLKAIAPPGTEAAQTDEKVKPEDSEEEESEEEEDDEFNDEELV